MGIMEGVKYAKLPILSLPNKFSQRIVVFK